MHHQDRWKEQACEESDLVRLRWRCKAPLSCHSTAFKVGDKAVVIPVLQDAEPVKRRLRQG